MSVYHVRAVRWDHGWELHIDGEGVTQTRTLDHATAQVRDYLETLHDRDFQAATIDLHVELDGYENEVAAAREATAAAAAAQERAAARSRRVAAGLRARGLSVADTAAILGVSRGRVSQLASH